MEISLLLHVAILRSRAAAVQDLVGHPPDLLVPTASRTDVDAALVVLFLVYLEHRPMSGDDLIVLAVSSLSATGFKAIAR